MEFVEVQTSGSGRPVNMYRVWKGEPFKSARAAGRGAKQRRNPPVQPRFRGQDVRGFFKRNHEPEGPGRVAHIVPCVPACGSNAIKINS